MELKRLISVTKTMLKAFFTLLFIAGSTYATSLTSTVSFDAATQIYTYNYTLTNNTTFGVINQFYVDINSLGFSYFGPLSVTTPTGWEFHTGYGPGDWMWYRPRDVYNGPDLGVSEGQSLSGFSFTSQLAPANWVGNNYEVFFPNGYPNQYEYGQIVAPDYLIPQPVYPPPTDYIPEPASLKLFGIAMAGWIGFRHRSLKNRG